MDGQARQITPFEDLFTEAEAVAFCKLPSARALRTLREKGDLVGQRFGKRFLYHRAHLVAAIERRFGVNQPSPVGTRSGRRSA